MRSIRSPRTRRPNPVPSQTTRPDGYYLFVQHVTAAGGIAPGWDPNGVPLCTEPGLNPQAVSDGKMGMIVAWEDIHDNISAQRVGGDFPTPTLVSLVSVEAEPDRVVLTWSLATKVGSPLVYRRGTSSGWAPLGAPRDEGRGRLMFEDRSVSEGRYAYRLGYQGPAGEQFTAEDWVAVPRGYELALVGFSPNPAVADPAVSFSLASHEAARLEVFDVSGRAVLTREVSPLGPGSHRFALGRESGLAAGVYWLRLTQQGKSLTVKGLVAR